MRYICVFVTPGNGCRDVEVSDDMTVADLVQSENLHGFTITLDGRPVDPTNFATTTLAGVDEVWATGGAKGARA